MKRKIKIGGKMSERHKLITERLVNLKQLKADEMKSETKSELYISDLNESIQYCQRELNMGPKDYEMVNVG